MHDAAIRSALRATLELEHAREEALVLDELGLCRGQARVDMAVVNGALNGYEIKGDFDRLLRLPGQEAVYSRALDFVTAVVTDRHLAEVEATVPPWWGIRRAAAEQDAVVFSTVREPVRNPRVDLYALAQLLWREEALAALEERGLADGLRSKPRQVLWRRLADELSLDELSAVVRQRLKDRGDWRSDRRRTLGGGSSRSAASSSRSPARRARRHTP